MRWIEIIELRSSVDTLKHLSSQLKLLLEQVRKQDRIELVKIYSGLKLDANISIHLLHESISVMHEGSFLGLKLVTVLKPYGYVSHSVWTEIEHESLN